MCVICEGSTHEQVLERIDGFVRSGHWYIQGVEAGGRHDRPWAYTVGLIENFDHPELVMIDTEPGLARSLLNSVAGRIAEGDFYLPGTMLGDAECEIEIGEIHPSYLRHGLCASWNRYYEWRGHGPAALVAYSVVARTPLTCVHRRARERDLERPGAFRTREARHQEARRRAARRRN